MNPLQLTKNELIKEAVLKVGEVSSIDGKTIYIAVDKNKNASDLLFDGKIIKNISVGGYVEIRKGFLSIIGKIEGERLKEEIYKKQYVEYETIDNNKRVLTVSLCGFINFENNFVGGIKELPLIGNEAFILTETKIHTIHNLLKKETPLKITIANTDIEDIPISLPVDGLFNSHIAIFGNTGSGKSNTLAALYQEMISVLSKRKGFTENCKFFFFDFNGEYVRKDCISNNKTVYNLSTRVKTGQKIPMKFDDFMDLETLSVLFEATEKTQRPFLKRVLGFYKTVFGKDDYYSHFKNIITSIIRNVLLMTNKEAAYMILDYIEEILTYFYDIETTDLRRNDIDYHNQSKTFFLKKGFNNNICDIYFESNQDTISETKYYKFAIDITVEDLDKKSDLDKYYIFILLQLIYDLQQNKVQLDHIAPVIGRFKSKRADIEKIFEIKKDSSLWGKKNIIVVNLHDINLDMRKTVPLLLAKHIYNEHKRSDKNISLSIIIDEAHNILSKNSFRETEDWKDYRVETFEEIIKEGRKFGVFVTISSQRPNDISETIISQAHNYFIHQLVNQKDLVTIGNAVSYIDKVTEQSIPVLPVGTCIFSGIATPMPLKIKIKELPDANKPNSSTLKFSDITKDTTIYL